MSKPEAIFILTVDTEEEWDWSGPFPDSDFSVRNVFELPAFQNYCQELGIKPTYLVDYAVANSDSASQILKNFNQTQCEIGAHLHPWANPPFYDDTREFSSHVINLPIEQVSAKLDALIEVIQRKIGQSPRSFRTGRWGVNGDVLKLLLKAGIDTDTSVYPLYSNDYFSCENAPKSPYWPSYSDTNQVGEQRGIFEIPVTCGFNRSNTKFSQAFHKLMEKRPFRWLRINGFCWQTLILRKLYLSPELCSAADMNRLVRARLKKGTKIFHMYLHSSSLIQQVTGLNDEANAREQICQRIGQVIAELESRTNLTFMTLTETRQYLTKESNK